MSILDCLRIKRQIHAVTEDEQSRDNDPDPQGKQQSIIIAEEAEPAPEKKGLSCCLGFRRRIAAAKYDKDHFSSI